MANKLDSDSGHVCVLYGCYIPAVIIKPYCMFLYIVYSFATCGKPSSCDFFVILYNL